MPTKTYDTVERVYYRIGEAAGILGVNNSKVRYWLDFFELPSATKRNDRNIPMHSFGILLEIKKLVTIDFYTLKGAMKVLKQRYGKNYEQYRYTPESPDVLGPVRDGDRENPPSEDSLAPDNQNQV